MNQPPPTGPSTDHDARSSSTGLPGRGAATRCPAWRLPPGVAPGTWDYTRQESIAGGYSAFIADTPLVQLDERLVLEKLGTAPSGRQTRVIDFGCGDGRTMRFLWRAGFDVLGIDLSMPMLRRCVGDDPSDAFTHRRVRANLVELDCLAADSADHGVCLFSTLGMIRGRTNRRRFLQHAGRIIRPGGKLLVHVHNRNAAWRDRPAAAAWLASARDAVFAGGELGDRTYAYRGLADMFLHTYSLGELRRDLRAAGRRVQEIIPLTVRSDAVLTAPRWLPGLRAGGFIAVA